MKIKPDMDRIYFLLDDAPCFQVAEKKFRKRLAKRKNPLVYVRPHVRNFPEKKSPLRRLMDLNVKKAKIELAIKECKKLLRSTLTF